MLGKYPSCDSEIDVDKMVELGIFDKNDPIDWKALRNFNMDLSETIIYCFAKQAMRGRIQGAYPTEEELMEHLKKDLKMRCLKDFKITYHSRITEVISKLNYVKVVFTVNPGFTATYYTEIENPDVKMETV